MDSRISLVPRKITWPLSRSLERLIHHVLDWIAALDRHFRQHHSYYPWLPASKLNPTIDLARVSPFLRAYGARTLTARCGMKWSVSTMCLVPTDLAEVGIFLFQRQQISGGSSSRTYTGHRAEPVRVVDRYDVSFEFLRNVTKQDELMNGVD